MQIRHILILLVTISCCIQQSCTSYKYSYEEENLPSFKGDYRDENSNNESSIKSIKVVSFNIEFANNIDGAITLLGQEPLKSADVILLQEMDEKGTKEIAENLQLNYVYYPAIFHFKHKKNVGNAILTKWDIKDSKKLKLPHPSGYPVPLKGRNYIFRKTATIADIVIEGKIIKFASTHAAAFNTTQKRKEFADAIVDDIHDAKIAVVGGDFNSFGGADINATANSFTKFGYDWVSQDIGTTISEKKSILKSMPSEAFQLDHLFVKGLEVKAYGKVNQSGVSDHLPIWVDLEMD